MNSHFGSEYLCPISLIRVFGSTMMEDLQEEEAVEQQHNTKKEICKKKASQSDHSLPYSKSINEYSSSIKNLREFHSNYKYSSQWYKHNQLANNINAVIDTIQEETRAEEPVSMGNQENVFKIIMKRLRTLEMNMTISLRLIQEQAVLLDSILDTFDQNLHSQVSALNEAWNMTLVGFVREFVILFKFKTLLILRIDLTLTLQTCISKQNTLQTTCSNSKRKH